MSPRLQIVSTLAFVLLSGPIASAGASPAALEEKDTTRDGVAGAVETYSVSRPKIKWCTRKTRIGDYADVAHRFCYAGSGDYNRRTDVSTNKSRFSIKIAASDGATAKVAAKRGIAYAVTYPEHTFGREALDIILDEKTGISTLSHSPDFTRIKSTITANITTSYSSVAKWELVTEELPADKGSGTLTNGVRTLQIALRGASPFSPDECHKMVLAGDDVRACFRKIAEFHEDGELLCSYASEGQEYIFHAGLSPELKLVLLAGMEAFRAPEPDAIAASW